MNAVLLEEQYRTATSKVFKAVVLIITLVRFPFASFVLLLLWHLRQILTHATMQFPNEFKYFGTVCSFGEGKIICLSYL